MAPLVRNRLILALATVFALSACVDDRVPVLVVPPPDTRMPVTIDYNAHRQVLHPPPKHEDGQVNPVPRGPGRERDFGPESRALPIVPRADLLATLAAFRAAEPLGHGAYLALAKRKAKSSSLARADAGAAGGPDADDPGTSPSREGGDQGGYRLNFEDAEVKDVVHAVLGNILGLTYTIAPNVTGRITVSSSAPQTRSELLSTLETVLSLQGLSLTKSGATYKVAPIATSGGTIDTNGSEPGFGVSVVPLEFSSATTVSKLISGFVSDADGVRIDTSQNAIVVRGPGPKREEIVRAIKAIDGDWMHLQSVSVVELKRSRPEDVIGELNRIFDNDPAPNSNSVVQFKAIKRLRAIMVMSRNQGLVRRATQWIRRLDHQDTAATESVFVYRPRYRDAKELTRLVNSLFNGGDSGGGNGGVSFQQSNGQTARARASGKARAWGRARGLAKARVGRVLGRAAGSAVRPRRSPAVCRPPVSAAAVAPVHRAVAASAASQGRAVSREVACKAVSPTRSKPGRVRTTARANCGFRPMSATIRSSPTPTAKPT